MQVPHVLPALTEVVITSLHDTTVLNDSFTHLARREGLTRLWLNFGDPAYLTAAVLPEALGSLVIPVNTLTSQPRPPFQHLRDLRLDIRTSAVVQLVPLLSSVVHLCLQCDDDDGFDDDFSDTEQRAIVALGTLTQLRTLTANLTYDEDDLASLHGLTQLRELQLTLHDFADYEDITDQDLSALLRRLCHLHTLTIETMTDDAPSQLTRLRVVGAACPVMRCLRIGSAINLSASLDHVEETPLLPNLESLDVEKFITSNPSQRQVSFSLSFALRRGARHDQLEAVIWAFALYLSRGEGPLMSLYMTADSYEQQPRRIIGRSGAAGTASLPPCAATPGAEMLLNRARIFGRVGAQILGAKGWKLRAAGRREQRN